jgi:Flp pilus assembly protein TadD
MSVSHANLGIIYRHKGRYEAAAKEYIKALELWPDNLAAENNMNVILNKPLKKRSALRHIFPKDRLKE